MAAAIVPGVNATITKKHNMLGYDTRLANLCHSTPLSMPFKMTISDIFEICWLHLCQIVFFVVVFFRNKFKKYIALYPLICTTFSFAVCGLFAIMETIRTYKMLNI